MGYATPEEMAKNQEKYIESQKGSENLKLEDNIIVQYGGGALFKPGSYDRYTPFKIYPEADFLVIAWPMGLVQASCNPFKTERALKGVNLGEIAKEVLLQFESELKNYIVPLSVIKRVSESKVKDESIGFKTSDLYALYGDKLVGMPTEKSNYGKIIRSILDTPWPRLSEKQKLLLDRIGVTAWDVIDSNSGGHKCITNIYGLNFFKRGKRDPKKGGYRGGQDSDTPYVDLVKRIQSSFVKKLKEKINTPQLAECSLLGLLNEMVKPSPTALINDTPINIEVMSTPQQQMQGMIGRDSLEGGMLFPYGESKQRDFHMRNCKISLDIVFIDNEKINKIHHNCPACQEEDCPTYSGVGDNIIEFTGGYCKNNNLNVGDRIDFKY